MPLSVPNNPPTVNEAVAQPASSGLVIGIDENQTKVNQLHGIASNNAQGAGIPKQVTNVQVSIANASTGVTCTVSVLFKADPTDKSFSGVNVWVKGYQGNPNPVQVGSGTSSPTKIVLNNTGEIVSFIVQAFGNGGNAPFTQSPTCSGTLPKSTSGGFGSSAVTSGGSSTLGGDVTGPTSTTVVGKIQGTPVVSAAPLDQEVLQFSKANSRWQPSGMFTGVPAAFGYVTDTVPTLYTEGLFGNGMSAQGTAGGAASTATSPCVAGYTSASSANSSAGLGMIIKTHHFRMFRLWSICCELTQTTHCRIWIGTANSGSGGSFQSDQPSLSIAGFRYSTAAGDTTWKCVCQIGGTIGQQTIVDSGVAVDTNFHLFQMYWDETNVIFYIDGNKVGQISTNVPNAQMNGVMVFVDNVGLANAVSCRFYFWNVIPKGFDGFPPFSI